MTTTDAKIDFLGEMIGLDDLINRVEAMARIETSIALPTILDCLLHVLDLHGMRPFLSLPLNL